MTELLSFKVAIKVLRGVHHSIEERERVQKVS